MAETHSKMVTTRRRKQRTKKDLARVAKHAKKLRKQDTRESGGSAAKGEPG